MRHNSYNIVRVNNEKFRVTAKFATEGYTWRIHGSPSLDSLLISLKPTMECSSA